MFILGIILVLIALALHHHIHKDDRPVASDGPRLTPEQRRVNYQSARRFVENNPDMQFCKEKLPEYVEDIRMTKEYEELERKFKAGEISYADYQIELNELAAKVKVPVYEQTKSGWVRIR